MLNSSNKLQTNRTTPGRFLFATVGLALLFVLVGVGYFHPGSRSMPTKLWNKASASPAATQCLTYESKVERVKYGLSNINPAVDHNVPGSTLTNLLDPGVTVVDNMGEFNGVPGKAAVYFGLFNPTNDRLTRYYLKPSPDEAAGHVALLAEEEIKLADGSVTHVTNDLLFKVGDDCLITRMDIVQSPMMADIEKFFDKYDEDKNGEFSHDEFVNALAGLTKIDKATLETPLARRKMKRLHHLATQLARGKAKQRLSSNLKMTKDDAKGVAKKMHLKQIADPKWSRFLLTRYLKQGSSTKMLTTLADNNEETCVWDGSIVTRKDSLTGHVRSVTLGDVKLGDMIAVDDGKFDMVIWIHKGSSRLVNVSYYEAGDAKIPRFGSLALTKHHLIHQPDGNLVRAQDLVFGDIIALAGGKRGVVSSVLPLGDVLRTSSPWLLKHDFFIANGVQTSSEVQSKFGLQLHNFFIMNPMRLVVSSANASKMKRFYVLKWVSGFLDAYEGLHLKKKVPAWVLHFLRPRK